MSSEPQIETQALGRAAAIAVRYGALLAVLRVTRRAALYATERAALERCRGVLGRLPRPLEHRMMAVTGEGVEATLAMARALAPALIVVSPGPPRLAIAVKRLARAARCPVLIARAAHPGGGIVAATDLGDERYPVVRSTVELAARLRSRITLIHHLEPLPAIAWSRASGGRAVGDDPLVRAARRRRRRLRALIERFDRHAVGVLRTLGSTVDAILDVARTRRAEMIAVGTYLGRRHRRMCRNVAARVVERSEHSVLVVPIVPREKARPRPC